MAYTKITYEVANGVALITLNDPATLNSASPAMGEELALGLKAAGAEARCVLLTGAGRAFCSGASLSPEGLEMDSDDLDIGALLEKYFNPLMNVMRDLPIPMVTAVNGAAAGIGASFALMGDLIVAGESAYFLQAFRRIGLVPDGGAAYLLPRTIGRARAMELMLLGDKLPARTALEWGLINRCVPDGEVMPTAQALAAELAKGPKSLGMIRKLAWSALDADWNAQLQAEREAQRDAGRTADFAEGLAAFLEKRKAEFKGA